MEPIRRIGPYERNVAGVASIGEARVRQETPEETAERRQREQRERARKQAARAWADAQLRQLESQPSEPDDEGHIDVRV
jgi:hypothetical protein